MGATDLSEKALSKVDEARHVAHVKGGRCLSEDSEIMASKTYGKLRWACQRGHTWEADLPHVKRETWCPYCAGRKVWNPGMSEREARTKLVCARAAMHGGQCLDEYKDNKTKLRWRCGDGHEWEALPREVLSGRWCPYCDGRKVWAPGKTKDDLIHDEANRVAAFYGGAFLGDRPVKERHYAGRTYSWRCAKGHEWETQSLMKVKNGAWCPTCAKSKSGF